MTWRLGGATCLAVLVMLRAIGAAGAGPSVAVEIDDGTLRRGALVSADPQAIEIAVADGGVESIPVARVRVLGSDPRPTASVESRVRLTLTDGATLGGDDFSTSGGMAVLVLPAGRAELPLARLRSVEWIPVPPAARRPWLDAIPDGVTSDLVVIGKGDDIEFVECAITAVDAETVTVVLDEETIPVRRSKVTGLRWLRGEAPPGRTIVHVAGGVVRADTVAWTPAGLVLDGGDPGLRTTLPSAALERIDYAAGRTTLLATLPPEKIDVDPFFGALGTITGLGGYFAPRPVATGVPGAKPGLVMRPRTVATWRIPPQSRRFRTGLARAAGAGPAVVKIELDGRPVLEQVVSGDGAVPVEIDVAGGRRLAVAVDFGPAGSMACAVHLTEPVIEQ